MSTYRCPNCKKENGLWEGVEVPGWRAVDNELKAAGYVSVDREVDWQYAEPMGNYGCGECEWEGSKAELEKLDEQGEPIPEQIPGQMQITDTTDKETDNADREAQS